MADAKRVQNLRARLRADNIALFGSLKCTYCQTSLITNKTGQVRVQDNTATVDHIIPCSKGGGKTDIRNMVICCFKCNRIKADKDPAEFFKLMRLNVNG